MIILAIDTAASLCAACVYNSAAGRESGRAVLDLGKGHAEHVMATIEDALEKADLTYNALQAIAVSIGPGSFTGVRVGVSAARGLALALKIPVMGVNTLEALAAEAREAFPGRVLISATGKRPESLAMALFDSEGMLKEGPKLSNAAAVAGLARQTGALLAGDAADFIAEAGGGDIGIANKRAAADILFYARIASERGVEGEKPKPLYLRAPDAKPQSDFALPLKGR